MSRCITFVVLVVALAATACTGAGGTSSGTGPPAVASPPEASEPALYLMLMWHQHQPFYPRDERGMVTRPWVRVHATKDYVDMVTTVTEYPDVNVTFNLTPVLLTQIQDFLDGARDVYWLTTEIPADQLDDEAKSFLMRRFFDVNEKVIDRFPRYFELAGVRNQAGGPEAPLDVFDTGDYRDLQVLFNLAWTDPGFLSEAPLSELVAKGSDFSEEDKAIVLGEHQRIVGRVFDVHREAWMSGQIEVTTTPLAHPILPLLIDTAASSIGDPAAVLPETRFSRPLDAVAQVERGLALAEELLGRRPVGMWPAEGAVSRLAAATMAQAGVEWIATGESVLAAGLGTGEAFPRGAGDVPDQAEALYQPHSVELQRSDDLPVFFRDLRLSDLIGFEYSGMGAEAAAGDFIGRLQTIRDALGPAPAGRPWVVSVILDGENAWESYPEDGKEFLNALYRNISETDWLGTITPSQYLDRFGTPDPLDHELFPGSWFQASYATWIGEDEEAKAWEYLAETREALDEAADGADPAALEEATEAMLFAEGSDWFWWYGADQSSGDDGYFDAAYRNWLRRVYEALGLEVPAFVGIPIISAAPAAPTTEPSGEAVTPVLDGSIGEDEWHGGTFYDFETGSTWAGLDLTNLYLGLSSLDEPVTVALGVSTAPPYTGLSPDGEPLGFGVTHEVVIDGDEVCLRSSADGVDNCELEEATGGEAREVAIPLESLGPVEPGDRISFRIVVPDGPLLPKAGPGVIQVPDVSNVDVRIEIDDPVGDDHGPGTYTYPTDAVFVPGSFDLTRFSAGVEGDDVVFTFEVAATIRNPWGSPVGLSVQTFDVYIDADPGAGSGARMLIDGRTAALETGNGWEAALTVEGWDSALYVASEIGDVQETKPTLGIVTLSEKGKVIVRVPANLLPGGDPGDWGYAVALLGQEGFPSSGVRRVRDVESNAAQYRFGGAPGGSVNHTRIIDLAWPEKGGVQSGIGEQGEILGSVPDYSESPADLGPDDVAQIPLLTVGAR
ncbi:MAG: glucodextranase DOMON-like domain-containing protein [Acidimicrobiia bacterium]